MKNLNLKKPNLFFPKNNEKELIKKAKIMGFKEIILIYDNINLIYKKKLEEKNFIEENIKIYFSLLIKEKKDINKYYKKILLTAEPKREFLEDKRINFIINLGLNKKSDHTHFRNSLNQVETKLGIKKIFFFNINNLIKYYNKRMIILGRWLQDAKLLTKYKNTFFVVDGAEELIDISSFNDLKRFKEFLIKEKI